MRAQVRRVGEAWEHLEKVVLAGKVWTPRLSRTPEPFKERGLKKEWIDWMKELHKNMLDNMMRVLEDKVSVFKGQPSVNTNLKRWDYAGIFRRAVEVPNCGFEKNKNTMEKRVTLLLGEFQKLKARGIDSELKLD